MNTAVVVRAAADLADEIGWEHLTLAAVAARLGVRQPSLYKHIESLADLRRAVSTLAVTELGDRLVVAVAGRSGSEALMHLAAAYRDYARRHPGRYAASVVAPAPGDREHGRVADAVVRTVAAVLRGYGFAGGDGAAGDGAGGRQLDEAGGDGIAGAARVGGDDIGAAGVPAGTSGVPAGTSDPDALHAIRALRAMLHGFVSLEAAGGFGLPLDLDESYRRMVTGLDAALRHGAIGGPSARPVTAR